MKSFSHVFRRQYYLPGTIQPRLLFRLAGVFIVVILISATIFYFLSEQDVSREYYKAHQTLNNTRELLLPVTVGVNLAAIVLACLIIIFPSHKIAGPIFHIQRDLEQIRKGKFPVRISVRKNDMLREFAEEIDATMNTIKNRIVTVQHDLQKLDKHLLEQLASGRMSEKELQEIQRQVKNIISEMSFFQIHESINSNQ